MRSVRKALAVGLALTAVAVMVVLSQAPLTVLASNAEAPTSELAVTGRGANACQAGERLPGATAAIRLSLAAFTGPAVSVTAFAGTRLIASGERGSGWDGETVTVPVRAPRAGSSPVRICFAIPAVGGEGVTLFGSHTSAAAAAHSGSGESLGGRLRIEYLGHGRASWLALLPAVARHMALGRAWSGIWVIFLIVSLMLAAVALVSRVIVRELHE